ncbi:MAG TPA: glycoside hydrolase family 6 protein, partial [Actinomycetota bacterium]
MRRRSVGHIVLSGLLGVMMPILWAVPGSADPQPTATGLYVPPPQPGALEQIDQLEADGDQAAADLIRKMVGQPQAVWVESGTPKQAEKQVKATMKAARHGKTVPVLVLYNIPFRDCAQFSAGGATTVEEYLGWVNGVARGIGGGRAMVILEPDGLGIIPFYTDINGNPEWCQPGEADPATAAADRFFMLNEAIDRLNRQPRADVYLDGTHSAWLGVGDAADRLVKAGVERAAGFFLNVSNYQFTTNLLHYGTWISKCLASGDFVNCPNQYWNGGPEGTKIADLLGPWTGVALSPYGEWSDESDDPALNTSAYDVRFGDVVPTTHFVIDTSRNGLGPWAPPAYPDPQDWCNPPGRGLGPRPTLDTGNPLVDAYLWVKTPGES